MSSLVDDQGVSHKILTTTTLADPCAQQRLLTRCSARLRKAYSRRTLESTVGGAPPSVAASTDYSPRKWTRLPPC
jgi:hypothetical protein